MAAVVFLVAEEILIWMISEMMTILGKNISKKPTLTRFLVGSEDLVVPEDSPSVDTPAWEAAGDAVVNEDRKEFDRIHFYRGSRLESNDHKRNFGQKFFQTHFRNH